MRSDTMWSIEKEDFILIISMCAVGRDTINGVLDKCTARPKENMIMIELQAIGSDTVDGNFINQTLHNYMHNGIILSA